jgi:hypothetical protein
MQKKLTFGGVVVLLLAVVGITGGSASSSNTRSSGDDRRSAEIVRVVAQPVDQTFLDLDHSGGATLGDQQVFTRDFLKDGQKVGFDGGFCTLVREPALFQCVATNSLPRGQLTAQGLLDFAQSGPFHLAITGGTRGYRTAHGEVTVVNQAGGTDLVTFRIIR